MGFLVFSSCGPYILFEKSKKPQPPDYSQEKYWIALPWRHDAADDVPRNCKIPQNQDSARADVFWIHPTVYGQGRLWNGDLESKRLNKKSNKTVHYQATAFNAAGKVFAPRYRQAVLKSFFIDKKGEKPLELAYEDIKSAFEYYLKNWNNGRPIILAGHSQGATHVIHLLKDYFENKPLKDQLVAAYALGMYFKRDELKTIPLSSSPEQTGCYMVWNTFAWNTSEKYPQGQYQESPCVNPLTMRSDEEYAADSLNKGDVSFYRFRVDEHVCDAQVHGGMLWVHHPKKRFYKKLARSYHFWDVNLFYMNIRENAMLRVDEFLKKKDQQVQT